MFVINRVNKTFLSIEPEIGIVKRELHNPNSRIVIASIQSACRKKWLKDLKEGGFDLSIVDKSHHSVAPTYERVFNGLGFL